MGLLSANMLAELARSTASVVPVLTITTSGDTVLRLCRDGYPVASASEGPCDPRVTSFGRLTRRVCGRDGGLDTPTMQVRVDDTDLGFAPYVYQLRGAAVTLKLMSANLTSSSDYFTAFTGVVASYAQDGTGWTLDLRMDDAWLRSDFPKHTFQPGEWPNIHQSAIGKPVPIIYGTHSAVSLGDNGMVPGYYVDTSGFRFVVAGHYCKSVPRVYLGGTLLTAGSGANQYAITNPTVAGRVYTCVDLVTDPLTTDPDHDPPELTCDVEGIEDNGSGSGTTVTNGAHQLKHLLHNWIYGDYRRGAWTTAAPLNATHFNTTASFFSDLAHVGSRWLGDNPRSGMEEVRQWLLDFEIMAFWSNGGTFSVLPFDHRAQNASVYPSDRIVMGVDDEAGDFHLSFEDEPFVSRIQTRWAPRSVDGQFLQSREDRDPGSSANSIALAIDKYWLPAATGYANNARDAASRRINRYRGLLPKLEATLPLRFLDYELGSDLAVTWARGLNEDGTVGWGDLVWKRRLFRLLGVEVDFDSMQVSATLQDLAPSLTSFAAGFQSYKNPAGMEDGSYYLNVGNWVTCTRASSKWVDDPVGSLVIPLGSNILPIDATGLLVEEASTNDIVRSGFDSGLTGWSQFPNGGTIATDTADLLLDPTLSATSVTVTAPAVIADLTSHCYIQQTTAAYATTDRFTISVDHKDDTGHQLTVFAQRSSDGFWWNHGTRSWAAGVTANKLPSSSTIARHSLSNILVGGAGSPTITIAIGIADDGTEVANQKHHIYFVQCEKKRWATSRIYTTSAVATRAVETVKVVNDGPGSTYFAWPNNQGTLVFEIPDALWNLADRDSADDVYLFSLEYDANNKWEVYFDCNAAITARLVFKVTAGGVAYTATTYDPFSLGLTNVVCRWTGSNAELGLTAGTASIRLQGGPNRTDAVFGTPPTYASGKSLYIGCKTGGTATNQWGGAIRNVRLYPFALSDGALDAILITNPV